MRAGGAIAIACFFVSLLIGFCCYQIAGNSLDLFIGGVLLGCIVCPPLTAIAGQTPGAALAPVGISIGIGCFWILPVWKHAIELAQWGSCMLVLCTLLLAVSFGVLLLIRLGCSTVASSAIATIAMLAWLSFPIWMSGALPGTRLHWSVLLHPLFAINGIVPQLGIWTEQQVAYGLTNVGQDAPYQLPTSAWPVIGFQSGLAMAMLLLQCVLRARPSARESSQARLYAKRSEAQS
jgi:hypothetical protein